MRGVELLHVRRDDLTKRTAVVRIATQGLHEDGNPGLVFDHQLQHHLVEVRAMIPTLAVGDMHDAVVGRLCTVIAAIDVKTGRVERGELGSEAQALGSTGSNETIEGRDAIGVEGIQAPPEHIIIAVGRRHPRPHETLGRFMLKKARHQRQLLIHEPEAIAEHRFDRVAEGDGALGHILGHRVINDVANAQFLTQARHKTQMVSDLTLLREWHRISSADTEILPGSGNGTNRFGVCGMSVQAGAHRV